MPLFQILSTGLKKSTLSSIQRFGQSGHSQSRLEFDSTRRRSATDPKNECEEEPEQLKQYIPLERQEQTQNVQELASKRKSRLGTTIFLKPKREISAEEREQTLIEGTCNVIHNRCI
jgi:hypothetical protein